MIFALISIVSDNAWMSISPEFAWNNIPLSPSNLIPPVEVNTLKASAAAFVVTKSTSLAPDKFNPVRPVRSPRSESITREFCNSDPEFWRMRYNHFRPHASLNGKTPDEVYFDFTKLF